MCGRRVWSPWSGLERSCSDSAKASASRLHNSASTFTICEFYKECLPCHACAFWALHCSGVRAKTQIGAKTCMRKVGLGFGQTDGQSESSRGSSFHLSPRQPQHSHHVGGRTHAAVLTASKNKYLEAAMHSRDTVYTTICLFRNIFFSSLRWPVAHSGPRIRFLSGHNIHARSLSFQI